MKGTLTIVLVMNWAVAAAKVTLGIATNSASVLADGFHSFSDGASNVVGLVGLRFASKPKDPDHPYGHKKIENFTAIAIAMMLFLVCTELLHSSINRLFNPVLPIVTPAGLTILVVTIFVNYIVMKYEHARGKELKSDIIIADSYHTKSDIYVSFVVIAGLIGSRMGIRFLDPAISCAVIFLIGRVGFDILRHASRVLCDAAVINAEEIIKATMKIDGVKGCHQIRTRGREDDIMMDLHVGVDKSIRVDTAHEITVKIEQVIKKTFPGVSEVIVHIEPLDGAFGKET